MATRYGTGRPIGVAVITAASWGFYRVGCCAIVATPDALVVVNVIRSLVVPWSRFAGLSDNIFGALILNLADGRSFEVTAYQGARTGVKALLARNDRIRERISEYQLRAGARTTDKEPSYSFDTRWKSLLLIFAMQAAGGLLGWWLHGGV